MKTLEQIVSDARIVLGSAWVREQKTVVPEAADIALGNKAGEFEGVVLYADMKGSTDLVHGYKDYFAAEIYKIFLMSVCEVLKRNNGTISSFDGDRVMSVFIGGSKCSDATKAALQVNAVIRRLNDLIKEKYSSVEYRIDYAIGIDISKLFAVKTGIRGDNDLAWIGDAANIAAKLSEIRGRNGKAFVTDRVFERMNNQSKYSSAANTQCMWTVIPQKVFGMSVYESTWYWDF